MRSFTSSIVVLFLVYLINQSEGCRKTWFGYDEDINCIEYLSTQKGKCTDIVTIKKGEQQSEDMTAGLYKGVAADATVNQANFLLLPREIARVISALIEATGISI